jgi:hypothetical protein
MERTKTLVAVSLVGPSLVAACMTATEVEETAVDQAVAPVVNPDTIGVGTETRAAQLACSPRLALCVAKVRDLTWAVRPATVARVTGYEAGQVVGIRGLAVGRAWVVATGRTGPADSTALEVVP